jgi:multiple sugar transport system ATP-binding protein
MAQVILKDVSKSYDGQVNVVTDFNLDVEDGEFIVLVGPSGCGKSTTLRMVAGLEELTGGTIQIGKRVVNDVPPKDRDIAMVFQSYALYPHMTVRENMAFALKLRKRPKPEIEKKVREAAQVLDIEHLLDRKPKALSGGQRQRVAVGRAIVRDPQCFLFDEPLSNLDAKLRVEMRAELKQLHQRLSSTTLYVTHDQEEAMTLGDRVVVMKDGFVQQVGTALEIYHQPKNRFVGGFLGSPPMNFFEGTIVRDNERLWFDEGSGRLPVPAWAQKAFEGRVGGRVTLGVRPEAMSDRATARFETSDNLLRMRVLLVQPLGDRKDVYLSTPSHERSVALVDAYAEFVTGESLDVFFDMARVHFFETGEVGEAVVANPLGGKPA